MPVKKRQAATGKKTTGSPVRTTAIQQKMTKAEIVSDIAEQTELSRVQVNAVLDHLEVLISRHVKKRSVGEFTLSGLFKIRKVTRPAKKARKGVPNPFRPGELMDVAAKPATATVRITPLKRLKESAR